MKTSAFAHEIMESIQYTYDAHCLYPKSPGYETRKWDHHTPYIIHPIWCAMTLLSETKLSSELRHVGYQALLWHDVLENTELKLPDKILPEVRLLVNEMTFRNFADEQSNIWNRSDPTKLLKLYDKTSNLLDGSWMTPDQYKIYCDHTAKLSAFVRTNYGNLDIVIIADGICKDRNKNGEGI